MQYTQGRRGPAFARRRKGKLHSQQSDARADETLRPSAQPAFMNRRRRVDRLSVHSQFDQRVRGPRAAAVPRGAFRRRSGALSDPEGTSWENVAEWYGAHLSAPGTYQSEVVWPGALRLLGIGPGKKFLDVACGEGTFAQMISKQGGVVTGIDASPTLIRQAQNKHVRNAEFLVADAAHFAHYFDGSAKDTVKQVFDGAAMILALQNVRDMPGVFVNLAKVLVKNAPFVMVLNHPAFRIPRQSSWGFEEERKMIYRRIDSYLTERDIPMQMHPGDDPGVNTVSFHRPLSSYISALSTAGFVIDALEEWISHKESTSGPRARAENRIRKEVPMFLAIRARKI